MARATLASQAPNVRITIQKNILEKAGEAKRIVIIDVKVKILASKDNSAIKIWRRWRIKFRRAVRTIRDKIEEKERGIAKREILNLGLTRPMLLISYFSSGNRGVTDCMHPKHKFFLNYYLIFIKIKLNF